MQKPYIEDSEDGSLTLEWIQKDKRFGIVLEEDLEKSCWFFATKSVENHSNGGYLPKILIKYLKKYFDKD